MYCRSIRPLTIVPFVLCLVLCCGCDLWSFHFGSDSTASPRILPLDKESVSRDGIICENTFVDFGEVEHPSPPLEHTFRLKNLFAGTAALEVGPTSCGCTSAVLSKPSLKPDEEGELKVSWNPPRGESGFTVVLRFRHLSNSGTIVLSGKARGREALEVVPQYFDFGDIAPRQVVSSHFNVTMPSSPSGGQVHIRSTDEHERGLTLETKEVFTPAKFNAAIQGVEGLGEQYYTVEILSQRGDQQVSRSITLHAHHLGCITVSPKMITINRRSLKKVYSVHLASYCGEFMKQPLIETDLSAFFDISASVSRGKILVEFRFRGMEVDEPFSKGEVAVHVGGMREPVIIPYFIY